jgi:hypothetical protein
VRGSIVFTNELLEGKCPCEVLDCSSTDVQYCVCVTHNFDHSVRTQSLDLNDIQDVPEYPANLLQERCGTPVFVSVEIFTLET